MFLYVLVPKKAMDQSAKVEYYFDYVLSKKFYQILSSQVISTFSGKNPYDDFILKIANCVVGVKKRPMI